MPINSFIEKYDVPNSIIFLGGKREVKQEDKEKLVLLGGELARRSKHLIFRSGNSSGSDFYFAKGVAHIDSSRMEVVIPFNDYRKTLNKAGNTISLDDMDLSNSLDIISESEKNIKTKKVVKQYFNGERHKYAMFGAFIIRDTVAILGVDPNVRPANFALFYDDFELPLQGGTGHTMKVCESAQVPYFTQEEWFSWR